jgi:hypothetical protein
MALNVEAAWAHIWFLSSRGSVGKRVKLCSSSSFMARVEISSRGRQGRRLRNKKSHRCSDFQRNAIPLSTSPSQVALDNWSLNHIPSTANKETSRDIACKLPTFNRFSLSQFPITQNVLSVLLPLLPSTNSSGSHCHTSKQLTTSTSSFSRL